MEVFENFMMPSLRKPDGGAFSRRIVTPNILLMHLDLDLDFTQHRLRDIMLRSGVCAMLGVS